MTFIHGYLLGGLVLAGLPVLLHLIMRQKPRQLPFPAFRFLRQQHRINQRRLRLQHFLLLALRMLLIAALCLALARPRLPSSGLNFGSEQPVAAILIIDTSMSMGLSDGKQTRLDEARNRARELLDEMADGSRLALIETSDETESGEGIEELTANRGLIRTRLDALRLRPANSALNRPIERTARILKRVSEEEEAPPRFLYVLSDRTRASWETNSGRLPPSLEGINVVYVDVGKDEPRDLAIDAVTVEPAVAAPGAPIRICVTVRATGGDFENDLRCQIDNDPDVGRVDPLPVRLASGKSEEIVFERPAPKATGTNDTAYQVTVRLVNNDLLPFNDIRHATFIVRPKPKVLTLADDPRAAKFWALAIRAVGTFDVEVKKPDKLDDKDLSSARVICLFQVARPSDALWQKLETFVRGGGGLAVVPGGDEMNTAAYNDSTAARLLPGKFKELVMVPAGKPHVLWGPFDGQDDLTRPFRDWMRTTNPDFAREDSRPFVNVYWRVDPAEFAVAQYADAAKSPAMLIRSREAGRTVQFTAPLDARVLPGERPWHNYWSDSSFGLVLVDRVCSFLAGATVAPELNYTSGQPARLVPLFASPNLPLSLTGPDAATEGTIVNEEGRLTVAGVTEPGNYQVRDSKYAVVAAFSVAVRREESNLDRVPIDEIEAVLGKGTVLPADRRVSLRELLQGRWAAPVELLPWLMMFLLFALTFEGLLANKFYRRSTDGGQVGERQT